VDRLQHHEGTDRHYEAASVIASLNFLSLTNLRMVVSKNLEGL
jgi:hypothetical protein